MYLRQCLTVLALAALAAPVAPAAARAGINEIPHFSKDKESGKTAVVKPVDAPKPVNERFPHAVLFGRICGGTIISPTWILTAAHCALFASRWSVLAGTNNTYDDNGVFQIAKRLVIHPLFSVGPYSLDAEEFNIKQVAARWDFLLVELNEPLPFDGKKIAAAKLDDRLELPEGLNVGFAGYGTDHFGGTMSSDMHAMEMVIQADERCAKMEQYNKKDMLCVKGRPPRFDVSCGGDSGSGLVDEAGNLVGVNSWGENDAIGCTSGSLAAFARVAAVRDWIRKVTSI